MAHKLLAAVRGLAAVVLMLFATNFAPVAAAYADQPANTGNTTDSTAVSATSPLDYTGQGINKNGTVDQDCDKNSTPYLLFVFTGGSATNVQLHGINVTNTKVTKGSVHFTTPYVNPPSSLIGQVYVTWDGDAGTNPQLVISHGCAGETTPTPTTPTVLATALACKDGDTTTEAKVTVTNNATTSVTYTVSVPGATSQNLTLAAGATDFVTFSGLSAGSHTATVTASGQNTATADFDVSNCDTTPTPTTPTVNASALACKDGDTTTDASVSVKNNATTSVTYTVSVPGASDQTLTLAAGDTGSVTFSGLAKGKYTATVSATGQNTATAKFTVKACKTKPVKVYVCKYVGTPGVNERLKKGNHGLVLVSTHAIAQNGWDGTVGSPTSWFSDAQGRSYVLGYESDFNVPPTAADCPAPQGPTVIVPPTLHTDVVCGANNDVTSLVDSADKAHYTVSHVGNTYTVTANITYTFATGASVTLTVPTDANTTCPTTDTCPNMAGVQTSADDCGSVLGAVTGGKGGDVLGASTTLANTGETPWATVIIALTVLGLTLGSAIVSRKPRLEA